MDEVGNECVGMPGGFLSVDVPAAERRDGVGDGTGTAGRSPAIRVI